MKNFLVLLILLTASCCGPEEPKLIANGYVRNIWRRNCFNVTFETDNGEIFIVSALNQPPFWAGLHGKLNGDEGQFGCQYTNLWLERN